MAKHYLAAKLFAGQLYSFAMHYHPAANQKLRSEPHIFGLGRCLLKGKRS